MKKSSLMIAAIAVLVVAITAYEIGLNKSLPAPVEANAAEEQSGPKEPDDATSYLTITDAAYKKTGVKYVRICIGSDRGSFLGGDEFICTRSDGTAFIGNIKGRMAADGLTGLSKVTIRAEFHDGVVTVENYATRQVNEQVAIIKDPTQADAILFMIEKGISFEVVYHYEDGATSLVKHSKYRKELS